MIGGFGNEIKMEYNKVGAESTPGCIKKSVLAVEGNTVYYAVTRGCAQEKNPNATQLFIMSGCLTMPILVLYKLPGTMEL